METPRLLVILVAEEGVTLTVPEVSVMWIVLPLTVEIVPIDVLPPPSAPRPAKPPRLLAPEPDAPVRAADVRLNPPVDVELDTWPFSTRTPA